MTQNGHIHKYLLCLKLAQCKQVKWGLFKYCLVTVWLCVFMLLDMDVFKLLFLILYIIQMD